MCRSIKTLREPFTPVVTRADIDAAALQYVRKISGFRAPAPHNAAVFDEAVHAVAAATEALLTGLVVRAGSTAGRATSPARSAAGGTPAAGRAASATGRPRSPETRARP